MNYIVRVYKPVELEEQVNYNLETENYYPLEDLAMIEFDSYTGETVEYNRRSIWSDREEQPIRSKTTGEYFIMLFRKE